MNLNFDFKRWFVGSETKASEETVAMNADNPYADENYFLKGLRTSSQYAGVDVNYDSAMKHNDVYTCVRIKAESLGQLPIRLYRNISGIQTEITSGREHVIFTLRPNPYQTWQDLIEMYVAAMEIRGNFYAQIKRNKYGNVYEIVPFRHQGSVSCNMDYSGNVYYTYTTNDGHGGVSVASYAPRDILHIKLFSTDGVHGLSPISQASRAIGTAIAGEKTAASMFEKGAKPSGVLETSETIEDEDAIARLRTQWQELYGGPDNTGKIAILEHGMTFRAITLSAVDAQLLEQRKFTREQIAAIFRVPIHLLQSTSMKYTTVEGNNKSFYKDSLMPLAIKLQNAINQILPENHIIRLDEREFVRGDRESQVKTATMELNAGVISVNETRVQLGYSPIDGGDVFAVKTNNVTFGRYDELPSFSEQLELFRKGTKSSSNTDTNQTEDGDMEQETNVENKE